MTIQTVLNVTQTALVIDTAGHLLGSREPYLYDDATITPANFAILQTHINYGRLRLLTGGVIIPQPGQGASFVSVAISGQNLVFTDSLGGTTTVAIPGGNVDLTPYARTADVTTALAAKAGVGDLSTGLATKVNSSTYTSGIAAVTSTAQAASDAATAASTAATNAQSVANSALSAAQQGGKLAGLQPFLLRLADRAISPINVVAIGSSTVQGSMASPLSQKWLDLDGQMLHASYNPQGIPGGRHSLAAEDPSGWTFTGTITDQVRGLGLSSKRLAAAATMSQTFALCTGFTVQFATGSGIGTFTVSIDGGSEVTVTPSTSGSANTHDGSWTTPSALVRGAHSIRITAVGATEISGVYAHDGDETLGVRAWNCGKGGAVAADFLGVTSVYQRLTALNPALVFIMYGSNDWRLGTSVATFKGQLQTHISQLKAAIAGPFTIAVVGQLARTVNQGTGSWDAWITAMKEVVAEDPAQRIFIDAYSMFPAGTDSTADPYDLIFTDGVHPTTRGHAVIADAVADVLRLPNRNSARAAVPVAPTALTIAGSPGAGSATVTATGGAGATSFALYQGTSATGTPVATSFPAIVNGLTNGTTYSFIAKAINSVGEVTSNTITVTPAVPTNTTIVDRDFTTLATTTTGGSVGNGFNDPSNAFSVTNGEGVRLRSTTTATYHLIYGTAVSGNKVSSAVVVGALGSATTPSAPYPTVRADTASATPTEFYGGFYSHSSGVWRITKTTAAGGTVTLAELTEAAPTLPYVPDLKFDNGTLTLTGGTVAQFEAGTSPTKVTVTDSSPLTGAFAGSVQRYGGSGSETMRTRRAVVKTYA